MRLLLLRPRRSSGAPFYSTVLQGFKTPMAGTGALEALLPGHDNVD